MRIALCQVDTTIGAFSKNLDKICAFLLKAEQERADLVVFPELCFSSYPPLDLLDRPDFVDASIAARDRFLQLTKNSKATIIIGGISKNLKTTGRLLQNTAVAIQGGKIVAEQAKRLLPTYDVFDEARYFEPGDESKLHALSVGGEKLKLGLSVCEDAWFEAAQKGGKNLYENDPALDLKGANLVINVSASPFELNKQTRRKELLQSFVQRVGAPLVYVNQVGANDEILFDGRSVVIAKDGTILFEMPNFREGLGIVDVDFSAKVAKVVSTSGFAQTNSGWEKLFAEVSESSSTSEIEILHRALIVGIRDYFRKTGFKKAVLGLSGGIDSAVVACLAAEALGPNNVIGVAMPSQFSSSHSLTDAEALARNLGIEFCVHSLKFINTALLMELKPSFQGVAPDVTEENIQARLRGIILMALANKRGALLLTTGNKSEMSVGYCTTYGDMAGAIAPIGDVYKTKVYALARAINQKNAWIPESSITKPPSAELRPNQVDQDSLPPYDLLDSLLEAHFEGLQGESDLVSHGFPAEIVTKILRLIHISEFKRRQAAPVLKVTSKAFGIGRRIPVAKGV